MHREIQSVIPGNKFWMVYNQQGETPRGQHDTEFSAMAEASRLSLKHPGQKFVILEAIGVATQEPDVVFHWYGQTPPF